MSNASRPSRASVALGILAGGAATRLGGIDKAQAVYQGSSLLQRVLDQVGGGFGEMLLSHNGDGLIALQACMRQLPDLRPGRAGPLAGIEALLHATRCEWLMTVPTDVRQLPPQLADTLLLALADDDECGVALADADGLQPLVALWPVIAARAAVSLALDGGEHAVHVLSRTLCPRRVDISPWRIGNLNSPADFQH